MNAYFSRSLSSRRRDSEGVSGGEGTASKLMSRLGARPQCCVMVAVMAFKARSCDERFLSDALRQVHVNSQPRLEKMSGAIFQFRTEIKKRFGENAPVKSGGIRTLYRIFWRKAVHHVEVLVT